MLQSFLELFTSTEKAAMMLAHPLIELIFMALLVLFVLAILIHMMLFTTFRKVGHYLKDTNRMDIEPLKTIKSDFDRRQADQSMKVETFVQEKFSSWRLFNIPVVNLIRLIQMTVSVFILLGVLGTFIGLTISLGSINAGEDQLVENVTGVLSGIDIAFYTSIVGMSFSLVMTVLIKVLNTEYMLTDLMLAVESHLEGHEQHGLNRMIEVSEKIHQSIQNLQATNQDSLQSIEASFTGFKDYTAGLEQSAKDLAIFNDGLSDNLNHFQALFHQMKTVTDGFSEGTNELNNNFNSLFSYFKKSDRRHERLVDSFDQSFKRVQDVSQKQLDSFEVFDDSVEALKDFTTSLLTEQEAVHTSLADITNENKVLVSTMAEHNDTFKAVFGNELSSELSGIKSYLGDLIKGFDNVGHAMGSLPEALDIINQTQAEHKHLLSERFDDLKEFNRTFDNHLKNHTTESKTFENHMREATSTFEQMTSANNQLISDIKQTISKVNSGFSDRDRQLEKNVDILKETLSNYVANLEGTLGQKLDAVIRNIGESMDVTYGGIKRDMTEMRRQSEDIQQTHGRATQQLLQDLGREIVTLNRQLERLGQQAQTMSMNRGIEMNRDEF